MHRIHEVERWLAGRELQELAGAVGQVDDLVVVVDDDRRRRIALEQALVKVAIGDRAAGSRRSPRSSGGGDA